MFEARRHGNLVPVAYRVSLSAQFVRIVQNSIKLRDGIAIFPRLEDILTAGDLRVIGSTTFEEFKQIDAELQRLLKQDSRKIIITTIFKFAEAGGVLNDRSNIIVMVDEAHRTQEGDLGRKMREALPNAFLFGLTGTPINRADRNTFYAFGAEEDAAGYMNRYGFEESIRDGTTKPLHFEPRLLELHIDKAAIDEAVPAHVLTAALYERFSSRGEAEAYLVFPYLYNRSGEWIGWVTPQREVYSVLGNYVGFVTSDPRIVRKRAEDDIRPRQKTPPPPRRLTTPAFTPLAPLLSDLPHKRAMLGIQLAVVRYGGAVETLSDAGWPGRMDLPPITASLADSACRLRVFVRRPVEVTREQLLEVLAA